MPIHCPVCDAENPAGGRFCIECGAPLHAAAVGSTERLPDTPSGKQCAACGVNNPANASFCVNCGRALEAAVSVPRPFVTATPPIISVPLAPSPLAAVPQVRKPSPRTGRPNPAVWGGISGGVFLIGLAALFATGFWWPGILVLLGVMSLLGATIGGEPRSGIIGAFWMIGLAVLFATGWWWPGILVLVGISAIAGAFFRNQHQRS